MLIQMKVKGLTMDPLTNMPIVILKDSDNKVTLPIWVGVPEANAIMLEIDQVATPRPMTHDLLKNVTVKLGAELVRVIINDLRDNTYFAVIELEREGVTQQVDSRPSDAIALALRCNAPIFVDNTVIEQSQLDLITPEESEDPEGEAGEVDEWLESLKPEDFGKYKM
ncbi:bifunctional nuclease family protein [bacterium]|nr:bifunctional nuclease family protein [candidate division CSSED10-310 bacterium]